MIEPAETLLVERIVDSDYSAFDSLYNRYWDMLLHIALKKTGDLDVGMDIVQDLFVDLWQRRHGLVVQSSLKSYLVSALYFKVFMHFRRVGVQEKHIRQYTLLEDREANGALFSTYEYEENYEHLLQVIEQSVEVMPERMKEVFNLKFYRSLSNQEIADALGLSLQTVKNQLSKALNHIRRGLPNHQFDATLFALAAFLVA